jgi:hypothetical protein
MIHFRCSLGMLQARRLRVANCRLHHLSPAGACDCLPVRIGGVMAEFLWDLLVNKLLAGVALLLPIAAVLFFHWLRQDVRREDDERARLHEADQEVQRRLSTAAQSREANLAA